MKTKNLLSALLLCFFSATLCFFSATAFAFETSYSQTSCIQVQENNPTIIELLEEGESYSIEITSIGCFNGTRQTVVVSNEAGVLRANCQENSIVLTDKDIQAFVNFENQLRSLKIGGCTTVDTYVLRYRNEKFQTSDGTCTWNGGRKLLQKLGLT